MKLRKEELILINGGASDSTFINAVVRLITSVIEIGRMIGSSLRRMVSKNYC